MTDHAPVDIETRRELFVDRHLVAETTGDAAMRLHAPERKEVVLQVEGPLENGCSGVYSVLIESDGRYLLYYRGSFPITGGGGDESNKQTANVAFSDDGIHFERPELGILDFDDGGANNTIWQGIQGHNFIPFRDLNPDAAEDARFKAVGGTGKNSLYGLLSPDGVHWRLAQEEPLPVPGAFDSANVAFFDPILGKYRLFSRFFEEGRGRAIQSCESDDFLHWTDPVPHQYADDTPAEQFYTNATTLVPGAEHILLSFPMRYMAERTTPVEDISAMEYPGNDTPGMTGMTDAVFMASRDGVHWDRSFLEAWLRPGLDERNWTHRNTTPAVGILPLRANEWSMYVGEHYGWPDNRLRRVALRPWGFASVNAGRGGGSVTTKPLVFSGGELRVNVSTSAAGSVAAEILDADGTPVDGFSAADATPFYGDRLDQPMEWTAGRDVSALAGRPVRLRFTLVDADVFAFRFAE